MCSVCHELQGHVERAEAERDEAEKLHQFWKAESKARDKAFEERDTLRAQLVAFVELFDGMTEPVHPIYWQVELAAAKRELARLSAPTQDIP